MIRWDRWPAPWWKLSRLEGIRPAQAGLLVDEVVSPVAVPATLVDLAVRGYLRIEDDAPDDWEKFDWRLVKLKAADKNLLDYERVP